MGACASVPKDIKADAAAAPLPEQPMEEETTTTVAEVTTLDKQVNREDGEKVVAGDIDKSNSLGSLHTESEPVKESVKDEKSSETTAKTPEEAKVSDETDAKQPPAEEKST